MRFKKGSRVEVFDHNSWKVGKILKKLENNYFVLRLFDSIELKEFHVSSLRVEQDKSNNRWLSKNLQASKKRKICNSSKHTTCIDSVRHGLKCESAEENTECSVASCSGNDRPKVRLHSPMNTENIREISDSSVEDTNSASSFAPKGQLLHGNIHELELDAYKSTVQALYASGPLSWEQESLLTNLRMCLHISNEEHLLQIRNMLSA